MYKLSTIPRPLHLTISLSLPLRLKPSCLLLAISPTTPDCASRLLVSQNNLLDTPHIMFRLPHIRQPRSPRSLCLPLNNFDPLYIWTIYLIPHLHAYSRQLSSQKYPRIDSTTSDIDANASERVASFETHKKDVTYFGGFAVVR